MTGQIQECLKEYDILHGQCLSRSTYKEDRQGIVKRILERVCPMEKILRIPFTEIDTADLLVDAVYEGGTAKNLGSEVLSKVMHVGNSGGFRKCMKLGENGKKAKDVAYVCIYTTGEEIEWRDEIDRTLGRFTYWGDNRKAGNPMTKTKFGGNLFYRISLPSLPLVKENK